MNTIDKASLTYKLGCIAHDGVVNGRMRHDIGLQLTHAVDAANADLRSTLDAVVKELESCRHCLADILSGGSWFPSDVGALIEAADAALAKAKAAK
jgi:hypothetical protein